MEPDELGKFEENLKNQKYLSVKKRDYDWIFQFSGSTQVTLSAPWRVVSKGGILISDADDGINFGLLDPINVELLANETLSGKSIMAATVDRETGDLTLLFEGGLRIDAFNNSSGVEGWEANSTFNERNYKVIAMGGGEVTIFSS